MRAPSCSLDSLNRRLTRRPFPSHSLSRRYISKIIFTAILGYPVDIGHMEAVNLISSQKYSEKQIVRPARPPLPFPD